MTENPTHVASKVEIRTHRGSFENTRVGQASANTLLDDPDFTQ